jgi:hypothetical protein
MNKSGRFISCTLLALAMCALAAAQDTAPNSKAPKPPSFCKPCLWYSGDFNWLNSKANALTNEKDLSVSQSAIYVPFRVPKGERWKITGVFGIVLSTVDTMDPAQADWSFSRGVSTGNAGKVIASGTSPATVTVLGCNGGIDIICMGVLVKGIHVALRAGKYWLTVVPYCTNQNDPACASARYFLADEEDDPKPLNHVGPKNILDDSFWNSTTFGANFELLGPAVCGLGCDMFSAGVLGKSRADGAGFGGQW